MDVEKLAKMTVGFSGADLENMVNTAAIRAAVEGKFTMSNYTFFASPSFPSIIHIGTTFIFPFCFLIYKDEGTICKWVFVPPNTYNYEHPIFVIVHF